VERFRKFAIGILVFVLFSTADARFPLPGGSAHSPSIFDGISLKLIVVSVVAGLVLTFILLKIPWERIGKNKQ
jgi:hypothetical protein